MGSKGRVLAVDDSHHVLEFYEEVLGEAGYEVYTATAGGAAVEAANRLKPQVILTDIIMPGTDGLELIERLVCELEPAPAIVVCSGFDACEHEAMNRGAMLYLQKPVHSQDLVSCIDLALRQSRMREETHRQATGRTVAARRVCQDRREQVLARVDLEEAELKGALLGLVRWVADYFGYGSALINLVERDKLRVVASHGEHALRLGTVVERELMFCSNVVDGGSTLILADASLHPCFKTHPALHSGFKFYVGVPLTTRSGIMLGTLCLVDKQPHAFTADDTGILEHLGVTTARQLAAAAGEPDPGPFVFDVPPVLCRETLQVVLGAELRRAGRHGGAIELALLEHAAEDSDVARACAAGLGYEVDRRRFAVARYAPNVIALTHAGPDPRRLRANVATALEAARRCTVLRGAGVVSYAAERDNEVNELALEQIADDARARAAAGGGGRVERVVLRIDSPHPEQPQPGG